MSALKCRKELENFASQTAKRFKVTVLPDFFIDRLIDVEWNTTEFSRLIGDVVKRKGGSIDGVPQTEMRGGNSINVASALANLGAEVTPIVCTSEWGLAQLKFFLTGTGVDLSHVKVLGKTNVMIRDLGALADFGPEDLDENDYGAINDADYACLFNWAGTIKNGTRLAQAVFGRAKKLGKGKTYFDTADPTPNLVATPNLMEKILKSKLIDILSVNENEAIVYARLLDNAFDHEKKHLRVAELAMEAARILARNLQARIDLHTSAFSATLRDKTEVVSPTFRIKALRATGAGDAWTAGNIVGDYNGLSDESRLTLANAVAACYLSDPEGKHPTWEKLGAFLKDSK